MKNSRWAIMWDCYGLEAVARVPDPSDFTFAVLKNALRPEMPNIEHWKLRAQLNPQRHYEIYIFESKDGIDKDDIVEMFEADPQGSADTIRRLGHCYYSDRATRKAVIT